MFAGCSYAVLSLLWMSVGLVMRALVESGKQQPLAEADLAAPVFLLTYTPELLAGMVFAGLLAAIMSTSDSFLNIGAAAIVRDMPTALLGRPIRRELLWTRVMTAVLLLSAALFALYMENLIALMGTFGWGTFAAAIVPSVAIGLNWKRATGSACVLSIGVSIILNFALELSARNDGYALPHGFSVGCFSMLVSLIVFIGVSLLSSENAEESIPSGRQRGDGSVEAVEMDRVPKRVKLQMTFTPARTFLALLACSLPAGCAEIAAVGNTPPRPNIVLILADDMGYSDLGCYGGEIDTPNLDRLAGGGLRFTQFYNTSRCCPTRASLMTGLYPHQAGVGRMTFDEGLPGYRGVLARNAVTVAEVLQAAGYHTAMVGKWHVSPTNDSPDNALWVSGLKDLGEFSDPATYPVNRGFDEHWGTIWGVVNFFDPFSLVHNSTPVESVPDDFYYTDALNDRAVEYIDRYSRDDKPFFLYLAHTAPHWPAARSTRGYREIQGHLPSRLGQDSRDPLPPHGGDGSARSRPRRPLRAPRKGSALGRQSRQSLGRPRHGRSRRHDRPPRSRPGSHHRKVGRARPTRQHADPVSIRQRSEPEHPSRYGPGFDRPSHLRDGTKISYDTEKKILPGPEDTYAGIGAMWANASNTPFRYWKKEQYEGGTATPLIVHWPEGLAAKGGSIISQPGHVIDIFPTALELAAARHPKTYDGLTTIPLEGSSLAPLPQRQSARG